MPIHIVTMVLETGENQLISMCPRLVLAVFWHHCLKINVQFFIVFIIFKILIQ